jgi:hypothetical protein
MDAGCWMLEAGRDRLPSIQHLNRSLQQWHIEKLLNLWRRRSEYRLEPGFASEKAKTRLKPVL